MIPGGVQMFRYRDLLASPENAARTYKGELTPDRIRLDGGTLPLLAIASANANGGVLQLQVNMPGGPRPMSLEVVSSNAGELQSTIQHAIQSWESAHPGRSRLHTFRVQRCPACGTYVNLSGFSYFGGGGGPPYRRILDSGINAAAGGDGMQIAPMNPFIHIYHATTGRNARGVVGNPGQQISRLEALGLWTSATSWFFDDEPLGTIEVGNYGDLIVLNNDYFAVPDEGLKQLRSVLTVVGGNVVHNDGIV